jgi:hypothetical protein
MIKIKPKTKKKTVLNTVTNSVMPVIIRLLKRPTVLMFVGVYFLLSGLYTLYNIIIYIAKFIY